jgi:SAM-dependent methyltransferase
MGIGAPGAAPMTRRGRGQMSENVEQIADWDGPVGEVWAEMQAELDAHTRPFGGAAPAAAEARPGERAIDVGCGCGDTAIALARSVGEGGSVLGVDVSRPMLAVARRRGRGDGQSFLPACRRIPGSPQRRPRPDLFALGVMFFDDPVGAFANMRTWLKPGGRLAFCCWNHPRLNPWAMIPVTAARQALNVEAPARGPDHAGPLRLLRYRAAGGHPGRRRLHGVRRQGFRGPRRAGPHPRGRLRPGDAVSARPTGWSRPPGRRRRVPIAVAAIAKALAPHAAPDGSIVMPGSSLDRQRGGA